MTMREGWVSAFKALVDEVASQHGGLEFNKRADLILKTSKAHLTVKEFRELEEHTLHRGGCARTHFS